MSAQICDLDANVLLRFLRDDDPVQSPQARELLLSADPGKLELHVSVLCVAETFYVLRSSYQFSRADAARLLGKLIQSMDAKVENEATLLGALMRVERANVDLGDAMLAETAVRKGHLVASFDRDFKRFDDVNVYKWP